MKKTVALLLALLTLAAIFTGCGKQTETQQPDKLKIVATIFPEYDWAREILGGTAENAEITLLLDSGVDLHSYQPTVEDLVKISDCELFLYVGGESDDWVESALETTANPNRKIINLLEILGDAVKTEETVEGMQEDEHEDHEDEPEQDEHVWLSLKNAQILVPAICQALQEADPGNQEAYAANTAAYLQKLSALDAAYRSVADGSTTKTILFGGRFPFRYLADDYGLKYYAAFVGCSAETEASFETVSFLARKVDEEGLPCVLTIEGTQHKIAETIVQNTAEKNQKVLTLDSMQSTTFKDAENGVTYLSIMEKNLAVLKEALGQGG